MFDLPEAKRIRRADLSRSPSPSATPDPTTLQTLHSQLAALYGPIPLAPIRASNSLNSTSQPSAPEPSSHSPSARDKEPASEQQQEQEQEQAYEFRLFSTHSTTAAPQKITLQSEQEDTGTGSFLQRQRNKSYYFTLPAAPQQKQQYSISALSGEQVLKLARRRAWGLEVPWRLTVLRSSNTTPASTAKPSVGEHHQVSVDLDNKRRGDVGGEGMRKTKPGKKRRIILREKARRKQSIEETKRVERERREEAERLKRTRRNREKKVKRKMKMKASKAGDGDGTAISAEESGSG